MAVVVLVFHLIICVGLVALVLLQRSEGGALGVGGGGGGALMSGRGAADALAKMTSVAGGVFLVTSLVLTLIQGAAQTSSHRSVFDSLPTPPAIHLPNFGSQPSTSTPAPTQSSAPAQSQTVSAPVAVAPPAASATERAGPVAATPTAPVAATTPRPIVAPTPAAAPRPATPAAATTTAAARPATTTRPATSTRPAAATTNNGVASGVTVPVESGDPAPVRRDSRAGPDQ